jgi:hypothetical protein
MCRQVCRRGAKISCLLVKRHSPLAWVAHYGEVEADDYQIALDGENLGNILACPQDQLLEIRRQRTRKIAARKAVKTRQLRRQQSEQLLLLPNMHDAGD